MDRLLALLGDLDVIELPPGWVERAVRYYERTATMTATTTKTTLADHLNLAASAAQQTAERLSAAGRRYATDDAIARAKGRGGHGGAGESMIDAAGAYSSAAEALRKLATNLPTPEEWLTIATWATDAAEAYSGPGYPPGAKESALALADKCRRLAEALR